MYDAGEGRALQVETRVDFAVDVDVDEEEVHVETDFDGDTDVGGEEEGLEIDEEVGPGGEAVDGKVLAPLGVWLKEHTMRRLAQR